MQTKQLQQIPKPSNDLYVSVNNLGRKTEESLELHHFRRVKENTVSLFGKFFPNILRASPNKMHVVCFLAENLYQNIACDGRIASPSFLIKQITINNVLSWLCQDLIILRLGRKVQMKQFQ